eukprot:5399667-Prymnesium_polylepis.1
MAQRRRARLADRPGVDTLRWQAVVGRQLWKGRARGVSRPLPRDLNQISIRTRHTRARANAQWGDRTNAPAGGTQSQVLRRAALGGSMA